MIFLQLPTDLSYTLTLLSPYTSLLEERNNQYMLLLTFLSLHNCGYLKFDAETNKMHLDCSVNIFKRLSLQE